MYDLVIIWALAFSAGPYAVHGPYDSPFAPNNQGTLTIDRALKTSKATCQAELTRAVKLNGHNYYAPQVVGSGVRVPTRLFVSAYCTPH